MFIDLTQISSGFEVQIEAIKDRFENELKKTINSLPKIDKISSAISYVLQSGGKRLRPLLSLCMLEDCKGSKEDFFSIAIALEFLHCASLVHDDLPALDDDVLRRGKNTCHIEFNEATAILTGDILIPIAISLVNQCTLKDQIKIKISELLCNAYRNLCYGQQLDILEATANRDQASIARLKTGELFAATLACAVVASGGGESSAEIAKEIGLHVGLCYQICDDYADQIDSVVLKGRSDSSDQRNNKQTFFSNNQCEFAGEKLEMSIRKMQECFLLLKKELTVENNFENTKQFLNLIFSKSDAMRAIG